MPCPCTIEDHHHTQKKRYLIEIRIVRRKLSIRNSGINTIRRSEPIVGQLTGRSGWTFPIILTKKPDFLGKTHFFVCLKEESWLSNGLIQRPTPWHHPFHFDSPCEQSYLTTRKLQPSVEHISRTVVRRLTRTSYRVIVPEYNSRE